MWPYSWTHVGTPSHLGHMDRVAATMPSQAHAGAAQEAPNIGQWEGQDVPLVRPSSCTVKGGIPSSRRYLPTCLLSRSRMCLGRHCRGHPVPVSQVGECPHMCPWVGPHAPSFGRQLWGAAQPCGVSLTTRGIALACLRYDRLTLVA